MADLFGRRCLIPYGYSERPFVYRIVSSDLKSNTWVEPPMTAQSEANPVHHDHSEDILIVVLDTLVSDDSKLHRVALKDVELLPDQKPVEPIERNGFFYCGACRYALQTRRQKYCSDCGRAVKQD